MTACLSSSTSSATSFSSSFSSLSQVLGVGIDVAHTARFTGVYERRGRRFLDKMLHPTECAHFLATLSHTHDDVGNRQRADYLAARWACKEALVKATGVRVLFPDVCLRRQHGDGERDDGVDDNSHADGAMALVRAQMSKLSFATQALDDADNHQSQPQQQQQQHLRYLALDVGGDSWQMLARRGIRLPRCGDSHDATTTPTSTTTTTTAAAVRTTTPECEVLVSVTHDGGFAAAVVLLQRVDGRSAEK
jgi:phosphopantetheine--protein transferase-like protein